MRLDLASVSFPLGFLTKSLYEFLFSPVRATCPNNPIIFDMVILIVCGEQYKL